MWGIAPASISSSLFVSVGKKLASQPLTLQKPPACGDTTPRFHGGSRITKSLESRVWSLKAEVSTRITDSRRQTPDSRLLALPRHLQSHDVLHLDDVIQIVPLDLPNQQLFNSHRPVGLVSARARPDFDRRVGKSLNRLPSQPLELVEGGSCVLVDVIRFSG